MRNNQIRLESKSITSALPKFFFYWKTYLWTMVFSIFSLIFLVPQEFPEFQELVSWSIIAVLSHLAILPFFFYAQNHRRLNFQITLILLAGISRGVVIVLATPMFGLEDPSPFYYRILNAATATAYWFLFGSILIEFMSNFRKDLRKLLEESIAESKNLGLEAPDVNSPILLSRIAELKKKITLTLEGDASPENLRKRASDIERLVKTEIRPLSHSEWRGGNLRWARAGLLKILGTALDRYPIPVWGTIFLTLPFSISDQLPRYGIVKTILALSVWTAILGILHYLSIQLSHQSEKIVLKSNLY